MKMVHQWEIPRKSSSICFSHKSQELIVAGTEYYSTIVFTLSTVTVKKNNPIYFLVILHASVTNFIFTTLVPL